MKARPKEEAFRRSAASAAAAAVAASAAAAAAVVSAAAAAAAAIAVAATAATAASAVTNRNAVLHGPICINSRTELLPGPSLFLIPLAVPTSVCRSERQRVNPAAPSGPHPATSVR